MDPYLEDPGGWTGVHDGLIARLRAELNRQLGPGFVADAGASVYVVAAEEQRWVFPDLYVIETRREEQGRRGSRIAAPVQVLLNVPETVSQPYILIRDRHTRRVVTVIEILSPINKAPPSAHARQDFLAKRHDTMDSATNWVEIDLLRAGDRPPEARGMGTYYVLHRRVGEPRAEIWPIGLRDSLPRIGVPVWADVDDVPVALQPLLDQVYDEGRYADLIDYTQTPPPPALPRDEAQWVTVQVERWLATRAGYEPDSSSVDFPSPCRYIIDQSNRPTKEAQDARNTGLRRQDQSWQNPRRGGARRDSHYHSPWSPNCAACAGTAPAAGGN
jgi:hypothetical protein